MISPSLQHISLTWSGLFAVRTGVLVIIVHPVQSLSKHSTVRIELRLLLLLLLSLARVCRVLSTKSNLGGVALGGVRRSLRGGVRLSLLRPPSTDLLTPENPILQVCHSNIRDPTYQVQILLLPASSQWPRAVSSGS